MIIIITINDDNNNKKLIIFEIQDQIDLSICNQELSYLFINTLSFMLSIYCLCTYINQLERTVQVMQPVSLNVFR